MVAKIFTEINTLQTPLDTLHELFLMHRFSIAHPVKKDRDFRIWDIQDRKTHQSRANHLSYELAARLSSRRESALFERIQLLNQNKGYLSIIKADQWLNYTRSWFFREPYSPSSGKLDNEVIFAEVNNFFDALINTCNHQGWADGKDRWINAGATKSLIQGSAHFQMILELYEVIYQLAYERFFDEIIKEANEIIPTRIFERILSPLMWYDWLAKDGELKIFKGGGESKRRTFQVWIEDALIGGESFSLEDVLTDSIKSERGKGLMAKPEDVEIVITSSNSWPSTGYPVVLSCHRPINAMKVATWTIFDENENNITESVSKALTKCVSDVTTQKIAYFPFLAHIKELTIRVEWIIAAGNCKGVIRLLNPEFR